MMTRIVSLATLLPMLLHSILGCCWHHDHGGVLDSLLGNVTVNAAKHDDDRAGDHAHRFGCHIHSASMPDHDSGFSGVVCPTDCASPGQKHDTPCEPCREEHCVYVGSGKIELPKLFGSSCLDVTSEVTSGLLPLSPMSIHGLKHQGDHSPPTSLSLRARTQVWLI